MTWSILARDADGRLGIAIASCFFAVGALGVPSRARPAGELDRNRIEAAIERFHAQRDPSNRSPAP